MMHSSESNSSLFYNDEECGSPLSPLTLSPSKRRTSSSRLSLSLSECSLDHYDGDMTGNHSSSSSSSSVEEEGDQLTASTSPTTTTTATMSPPPLWNNSYNKRLSSSFSSATLLTTATVDCSEHSEHSLGSGGGGDFDDEEERLLLQSLQNEFQQEAQDIRWSAATTPHQDSRCQHDAEIAAMMAAQFAAPAATKPVVVEQYKLKDTWCDRMLGLIVGLTLVIVFGIMGVVVSNDDEWGNNNNVGDLYSYTCPTSWTELQRQLFVAPTTTNSNGQEEEEKIFSNATTTNNKDEACLRDIFELPMEETAMQTILGKEYNQYHTSNNDNENNANLDTLQDKNVIFWGIPFQGMDDVLAEVPGSTYVGMSNERISTLRYRMNNPINNNSNNGDASSSVSPENANEEQVWWITIGWNELQLLTQQQEEEQAKRATTKSVQESNEETSPKQSIDEDNNNYDTCSVQSSLHQMQLGILDLITSIQDSTTADSNKNNNNRNIKIIFHGIRNLDEELDVSFSDKDFNRAVATTTTTEEQEQEVNEISTSTTTMTLNSLVQAWNQRLECITELGAQDESLPAMDYFQFQPASSSSSSSTEEEEDDFFGDAMYTASKTTKDKDDTVVGEEVKILTRTEQIVAKIQQLQSN